MSPEVEPSNVTSAVETPEDPRREKRLSIAVPVKLFLTPNSDECQLCCTYEISMLGARLMAARGVERVGQVLWMQRNNKRAKYKVIWIGEPGTPYSGQIGVEAVDSSQAIWEPELRMRIMRSA